MASVLEDQDYVNKIKQQAASIYDPQRDLALNKLDQASAGLDINQTDIGRQYDTLGQTLRDTASKSGQGLEERYNQLGLLQSGRTAAGLGDIQKNLNTNLGNAEADKASRLAQLALQRAGLTTQRAQVQGEYGRNLNDYVQQLLGQEQKRRDDEIKYQQQLQLAQQKAAISASTKARKSSGGIKSSATQKGLTTAQYKSAYDNALSALEDADVMNVGNRDRFLSAEEIESAQSQVASVANSYGIDPDELWQKVWNENQYQQWIPGVSSAYGIKSYPRVTKERAQGGKTQSSGGSFVTEG